MLFSVAQVLENVPSDSSTGKFETKAQILAKRPIELLASTATFGKVNFYPPK